MISLDDAKRDAGRGWWDAQHERVRSKNAVLLVEGEDDRLAIEAALSAPGELWQPKVAVVAMYGRDKVLAALRDKALPSDPPGRFPLTMRVVGLVDRDTWSEEEVVDQRARHPNLFVTPGWCLENSLLLAGDGVRPELEPARMAWVSAGALGWAQQRAHAAVNLATHTPLWEPDSKLDFRDEESLTASLRALNPTLDGALDGRRPGEIAHAAMSRLSAMCGLAPEQQWLVGVHGKAAFRTLYVRHLNHGRRAAMQRDASGWRQALAGELAAVPVVRELAQELLR